MKRNRKYPRRIGMLKIKEEIEKNGGEPTLQQQSLIATNKLKQINEKINRLLIKSTYEKEELTDEDYLLIISTTKIVENKFKKLFKTK